MSFIEMFFIGYILLCFIFYPIIRIMLAFICKVPLERHTLNLLDNQFQDVSSNISNDLTLSNNEVTTIEEICNDYIASIDKDINNDINTLLNTSNLNLKIFFKNFIKKYSQNFLPSSIEKPSNYTERTLFYTPPKKFKYILSSENYVEANLYRLKKVEELELEILSKYNTNSIDENESNNLISALIYFKITYTSFMKTNYTPKLIAQLRNSQLIKYIKYKKYEDIYQKKLFEITNYFDKPYIDFFSISKIINMKRKLNKIIDFSKDIDNIEKNNHTEIDIGSVVFTNRFNDPKALVLRFNQDLAVVESLSTHKTLQIKITDLILIANSFEEYKNIETKTDSILDLDRYSYLDVNPIPPAGTYNYKDFINEKNPKMVPMCINKTQSQNNNSNNDINSNNSNNISNNLNSNNSNNIANTNKIDTKDSKNQNNNQSNNKSNNKKDNKKRKNLTNN